MAQKYDLNKLRTEIDSSKRERRSVAESVQGSALLPKDVFLKELLTSIKTGQESHATNLIKVVENKTAQKFGEVKKHDITPIAPTAPVRTPQHNLNEVEMSPERDEQLFADFERRRKQTLAESIDGFNKTVPQVPNYNNIPYVGQPMQPQQFAGQPMQLNEQYLAENVKKIVNNYLIENFGPVVEEAIKSTILEMYAVERIKEVLTENREMIKTVVIETIREIQARSKKAQ
jgi:hypothetical protein